MTEIAITTAALFLGWAANILSQLVSASNSAGGPVNPLKWASKRPYTLALGVVGAMVGYLALYSTGQLNMTAAAACGWLGKRALETVMETAGKRLGKA